MTTPVQTGGGTSGLTIRPRTEIREVCDAELVVAFQAGGSWAFDELYRRHFAAVRAVCLANVRDPHVADDLAQEAFVRLFEQLATFQGDGVLHWLRRVAKNLSIDDRRRFRNFEVPLDPASSQASERPFEDMVLARQAVGSVLCELRDAEAALLRDHHLRDMPLRLMATAWNSTEKSLSVRLTRARRSFAAAGGHLRTLVLWPLLWRVRANARHEAAASLGSTAAIGLLQLAVVAAMAMPMAGAAADDRVAAAPHDIRISRTEAAERRAETKSPQPNRPARDRHAAAPVRQLGRDGRDRVGTEAEPRVIAPVSVPGTKVRVHQDGPPPSDGFRYAAEVSAGPIRKGRVDVASFDAKPVEPVQEASCPLVNATRAGVSCSPARR